ncbi:DNA-directed DNA polymerase [Beutenbergia cavernae DSM 12333]|uniref:DNA-directed DNA polymerase n=1 Tax=Beutenbergia cavernae (strain ATCC BAA-8 / DSM 12333 / CCUG 43141 / JCM 11478 / NBRC 16432 / NCIMB 13614 / HKI 0122) TaxID=471853 RepID=C5C0B6_BEUC1|nr:bifunctional 3'-5' exonuclease/DNA polymerase [Beutenbergia cavernae]ACQ79302.1 DNA-directed DNA polymerase [Beutenbergia cavernae DSM 12333]
MNVVVAEGDDEVVHLEVVGEGDDDGPAAGTAARTVSRDDWPGEVARTEAAAHLDGGHVRWVWDDTSRWYPELLRAGVRVERCHDLRLAHTILRRSTSSASSDLARADPGPWDVAPEVGEGAEEASPSSTPSLFEQWEAPPPRPERPDPLAELALQEAALRSAGDDAGRLRLLIAAESSGALVASELQHDGLPFRVDVHDATLTRMLGPRPARVGQRPALLEALAAQVRDALDVPTLNPDSQPDLLRALRRSGLDVTSTSKWELQRSEHPAVAPLLEYKKLYRLLSANGWAWMDQWVTDGRFRAEWVPGGVVTGRWATRGGGALQLPKGIRSAVRADDGWLLVIADAAQLEPRILAAMSGDDAMVAAGARGDLYAGLVEAGVVDTRAHAKVAMLAALYGATTGQAAMLVPRLARAYPRAVGLVDAAARVGENGGVVSTWLGRSSVPPGEAWHAAQSAASAPDATPDDERRARSRARDWGRFTRNFVVQGTAAEWALCWMAALRRRLASLEGDAGVPRLAFFLHDELIVHTPGAVADDVAAAVRDAGREASRLLFGPGAPEVPLDVVVAEDYGEGGDADALPVIDDE